MSDNGLAGVDPMQPKGFDRIDSALTIGRDADPTKIAQQVAGTGYRGAGVTGAAFQGGGGLFSEPILVVNQKAKLIELNNQYTVFNSQGQQVGSVNEVGQSKAKKAMRLLSNLDQYMTHKLLISDANGAPVLQLTRPAKVFKSTVIVSDPNGAEIGKIVQDNVFGKIHFTLEAGGQTLGSINAENWRAWNFRIDDHTGQEVARITKTFEGIAKAVFTTADNYVVQMHTQLPQPFLSLVVAAACSVDTALKQDDK
ncbi:MAG: hypothetical protein JWN62_62 [Acidimicrobiales bacterium]|nr:hypothetical protein [Acidimicrobiales bacterium]